MITADGGVQPQSNAYDMSSGLMGGAANTYQDIAQGGALQNINAYLNPFYEQVVNSAMGRMDIERDKTLGNIGDQAQAGGAFGGARHGLVEGEFLGQDQMNRGQLQGDLMARGFTEASQAARGDLFGAASGATQLGNQYFNVGNTIADRQGQAGQMQRELMQALLTGGADRFSDMMQSPYQTIDMFNAILGNDARLGAGQATQTSTPGLFDYLSLGAGMYASKFD